jgi:hypothetical protein
VLSRHLLTKPPLPTLSADSAPRRLPFGLLLSFLIAASAPAAGETPASAGPGHTPRGPAEIRDGHLLAQSRLTLPALSTQTLPAGRFEMRTSLLWANSFSWTQDEAGENPEDRRFLLDGETATFDLTLRRGLTADLDMGLRLTAHGRGGGTLDAVIDAWHRLANVPDGKRPSFARNAFRVEGLTTEGVPFSWNRHDGWGLGPLELDSRWRVVDGGREGPSVALVARVLVPTGTGPYAGGGLGAGGQLAVDVPLGRRFDLFTGMGVTAQDPAPVRGIEYDRVRFHGYLALEWRVARWLSLAAETNAASRLASNIDRYPGTHWMVDIGGRMDLGARTRLDVFVTENILSQLSTADFGIYLALSVRP